MTDAPKVFMRRMKVWVGMIFMFLKDSPRLHCIFFMYLQMYFLHIILNVIYLIFENAKLIFSGHYCSLILHANMLCLGFFAQENLWKSGFGFDK